MTARKTARAISLVGGALIAAAVIWWAIMYIQVYFNTGLQMVQTASCMLYMSDLCSLAISLCKGNHFLGIKWYSTDLLWGGVALLSGGLLLNSFTRGSLTPPPSGNAS